MIALFGLCILVGLKTVNCAAMFYYPRYLCLDWIFGCIGKKRKVQTCLLCFWSRHAHIHATLDNTQKTHNRKRKTKKQKTVKDVAAFNCCRHILL